MSLKESRYLIIANKETDNLFRFCPFERDEKGCHLSIPDGYVKATGTIPFDHIKHPEWLELPIVKGVLK